MKEIKLLAIDASTLRTGVAFFINGEFLKNKPILREKDTLHDEANNMIKPLLDALSKEKPEIVIIETPTSVNGNVETQKNLCRIYGAVEGWCYLNNVDFHSMYPSEWRKWCCINDNRLEKPQKGLKRKELKKWAIECVNKIYPTAVIETDDDAECILLGKGYIQWFQDTFVIKKGENG